MRYRAFSRALRALCMAPMAASIISMAMGLAVAGAALTPAPAAATEVVRVLSPGGIEAWLVRDPAIPVLALEFSIEGGWTSDSPGRAGLSEMAAATLTEGAGDLDSKAFRKRLDDLSISLSFSAGREGFHGSLKTLTRHRDAATELLRLALADARFDTDALERTRQALLIRWRRQQVNPDRIAWRLWRRAVFGDHPYGGESLGTPESLAAIDADDLRGYMASRMVRSRLLVGVAGDIDATTLGRLLDDVFLGLPADGPLPPLPEAAPAFRGDVFVHDLDIPQSVVVFGQRGLARDHPDWYAGLVMNQILGGGGLNSRLNEEIREKRGLVYGIGTYPNPMKRTSMLAGSAATANARAGQTVSLIRAEWRRFQAEGASDEEMDRARAYLAGSFVLRQSSTDAIARLLVSMQHHRLGLDYIDRRAGLIESVTPADVARLAGTLLDPGGLTFAIVGRPEGITPTAQNPHR